MTIKLQAKLPQVQQLNSLMNIDEQDLVDDPRRIIVVAQLRPLSVKQMLTGKTAGEDEIVLDVLAIEHLGGGWAEKATQLMMDARGVRTGSPSLFPNLTEFTSDELGAAVAALLVGGYDHELVGIGLIGFLAGGWPDRICELHTEDCAECGGWSETGLHTCSKGDPEFLPLCTCGRVAEEVAA